MSGSLISPDGGIAFLVLGCILAAAVFTAGDYLLTRLSDRRHSRARAGLERRSTRIVITRGGGYRVEDIEQRVGLARVTPIRPESERLPKDAA